MNFRRVVLIIGLVLVSASANAQLLPSQQAYTKVYDTYGGAVSTPDAAITNSVEANPNEPVSIAYSGVESPAPVEVTTLGELRLDTQPDSGNSNPTSSDILPAEVRPSTVSTGMNGEMQFLGPQNAEEKWACRVALDEKGRCRDNDKLARLLTTAIIGAHLSDYLTTRRALSVGGREANPIMAWPLRHEPIGISMKLGLAYLQSFMVTRLLRDPKPEVRRSSKIHAILATALTVGVYSWVSKHNLGVAHKIELRKQR